MLLPTVRRCGWRRGLHGRVLADKCVKLDGKESSLNYNSQASGAKGVERCLLGIVVLTKLTANKDLWLAFVILVGGKLL